METILIIKFCSFKEHIAKIWCLFALPDYEDQPSTHIYHTSLSRPYTGWRPVFTSAGCQLSYSGIL